MRAHTNDARGPRDAASAAPFSSAEIEATLRQAHVHVDRYFRTWLGRTAGGEALAVALAVEALVRIARLPVPAEAASEAELVATWLSIAHGVAREMVEG